MAGKARVSVAKIVDKKEHNVWLIKWRSRRRGRGKDATQEEAALHKAAPSPEESALGARPGRGRPKLNETDPSHEETQVKRHRGEPGHTRDTRDTRDTNGSHGL